ARPRQPGAGREAPAGGRRQARPGGDARPAARGARALRRTRDRAPGRFRGDRRGHPRAGTPDRRRGRRGARRGPRPRAGAAGRVSQLAHKEPLLRRVRRAVVKVGSNVLADADGLRLPRIRALAAEIAGLVAGGRQIVVVSSGAVAAGGPRLAGRRGLLEWRQAAAAVGQPSLMAADERAFRRHDRTGAQVLLTHADLADRRRYLNARHTLRALLALGTIPIVNENDTVAVEELKFGDNDTLSALTAALVEADLLVILSDVAGLHATDPRHDP